MSRDARRYARARYAGAARRAAMAVRTQMFMRAQRPCRVRVQNTNRLSPRRRAAHARAPRKTRVRVRSS